MALSRLAVRISITWKSAWGSSLRRGTMRNARRGIERCAQAKAPADSRPLSIGAC
jgi:hypothetical protein